MGDHVPAKAEWWALNTIHACAGARVRFTSPENGWEAIAASRFLLGQIDVTLPPLAAPTFGINYGEALRLERALQGRRTCGRVTTGQLAILPPDAATRWSLDRTGDIVLVSLSPKMLDEAIQDGADRDPRLAAILPRFLIRDFVLERIAHQLLKRSASRTPVVDWRRRRWHRNWRSTSWPRIRICHHGREAHAGIHTSQPEPRDFAAGARQRSRHEPLSLRQELQANDRLSAASILHGAAAAPGTHPATRRNAYGSQQAIGAAGFAQYFGRDHLGAIRGASFVFGISGAAFGPLPFAASADWTGSYVLALGWSCVLCVACGLASFVVRRP